jgi:transposase
LREENGRLREIFDTATAEFARLRGQVRSLEDELERERRRAEFFEAQCGRLDKELEKSQARANKFASMLFAIKSEKLKLSDIEVGEDAVAVESGSEAVVQEGTGPGPLSAEGQAAAPVTPKEEERKRRGARQGHPGSGRKIPEGLPVEEVRVEIPAEALVCPVCGKPGVEKPGIEAVSYQVTVKKQFLLRRIVRAAYGPACDCGKLPALVTAPPPAQLIPKGKFSEEFWVDILVSKFMSHLPVNRQLFEMVQAGIEIRPGTVFNGLRKIYGDYLKPLHDALILELRLAGHWHADETRWRMFLEGCKSLYYYPSFSCFRSKEGDGLNVES